MRTLILTSVVTIAWSGTALAQSESITADPLPQSAETSHQAVYDPFEGVNRRLYAVHDVLDRWILEPAARGYRFVTPRPVRGSVRNFLSNLNAPVVLANDLLQGQARRAGATVARFGVNSTVGVLGLFDPAQSMGLEPHTEDFGQTLAVWGVSEGPYLFVPLFGPTNLRDGFGNVVDAAFDPLSWTTFEGDDEFALTRGVIGGLAMREELLDPIDSIRATSIDPYARFRSLNALNREGEIRNGAAATDGLPDFDAPQEDDFPAAIDAEPLVPSTDGEGGPALPSTPIALNTLNPSIAGGAAHD